MKFIFTSFTLIVFFIEAIIDSIKEVVRPKTFIESVVVLGLAWLTVVSCGFPATLAIGLLIGFAKNLLGNKNPIVHVRVYDDRTERILNILYKYYPLSSRFDLSHEKSGHVYINTTNPFTRKKRVVVAMSQIAIVSFFHDIITDDAVPKEVQCYLYEEYRPPWECTVTFGLEVVLQFARFEGVVPSRFRPKVLEIARNMIK